MMKKFLINQTAKLLSFNETNHAVYFDQMYEKFFKKSHPIQQLHLNLIRFFFFQERIKQQVGCYEIYVKAIINGFPSTGLAGFYQLGFISSIFHLPLAYPSKKFINYSSLLEKISQDYIPSFLKVLSYSLKNLSSSLNSSHQQFISLHLNTILHQLNKTYFPKQTIPELDQCLEQVAKFSSNLSISANETENTVVFNNLFDNFINASQK